ncbi:hypothetical protein SK128_007178 [Halocaridina rubra]|uniref:Uncharacterized protein n=1 Tax=Halocaridina rubra TaxID=373956 RepID=A0AAN8WV95_HALRR
MSHVPMTRLTGGAGFQLYINMKVCCYDCEENGKTLREPQPACVSWYLIYSINHDANKSSAGQRLVSSPSSLRFPFRK